MADDGGPYRRVRVSDGGGNPGDESADRQGPSGENSPTIATTVSDLELTRGAPAGENHWHGSQGRKANWRQRGRSRHRCVGARALATRLCGITGPGSLVDRARL